MTGYEEKKKFYIKYNLSFFDGGSGEKTEEATGKKKEKAREEGQVAKSQEIGTAFLFLAAFMGLKSFSSGMYMKMLSIFDYSFHLIRNIDDIYTTTFITNFLWYMFMQSLLIALPILALALVVGVISNVIQVGWHPTTKPLMPKFSKLSPLAGIKRLFSFKILFDLLKALGKFFVIGMVIYNMIVKEIDNIPALVSMTILEATMYIGDLIIRLGLNVGIFFFFIAIVDYAYTIFKHKKDLKMTKQEVKEEHKSSEGSPEIKGKIRQRMREASMRRMMQSVPSADVIITNPTHYAVAVQYDREKGDAPVVVAKGVDFLAKRIRDAAKESNIEIVENVQLARALYNTVDIGKQIPPELYQAVAEILAFVYKLKNKTG